MKRLLTRLREAFSLPRETREVAWDDAGFEVREHGRVLVRVQWQDIREIFAYKEDRFTVDDICLGFRAREDDIFYMVSEDFVGYRPFLTHLEQRFSGIRTDWFSEVAFPAFEPNRTTLWGEPPAKHT